MEKEAEYRLLDNTPLSLFFSVTSLDFTTKNVCKIAIQEE
jgi:hypothetical protein